MNKPRVMITATGSGVGKTTICCAILRALTLLGYCVGAFKSGPDYIDPMFHEKVLGIPSRNLDLFMLGETITKQLLAKHLRRVDLGVIEGAMGFYDGIYNSSKASAHHLSQVTQTPAILVVSAKGMARSLVASIKGYLELEENLIKGIILNGIKPMMYPFYKKMIEEALDVTVMGYLPYMENCEINSRHLGLQTPDGIEDIMHIVEQIAHQALKTVDFEKLIALTNSALDLEVVEEPVTEVVKNIQIGVAKDAAFSFYYEDSLDLLREMGAEIVFFSPLKDEQLPQRLDGLWIGGGYPELYAKELSANDSFKKSLKSALEDGMPCIAECGGFMYLQQSLKTLAGESYKMVGYLEGMSEMTKALQPFGYITLEAKENHLLMQAGACVSAHEFHYSKSSHQGTAFNAYKPLSKREWQTGITTPTLYAGYPHLHLWSKPDMAKNYVLACENYRKEKGGK